MAGTLAGNLPLARFSQPTLAGSLSAFAGVTLAGVLTERNMAFAGTGLVFTPSISGYTGAVASFALVLPPPGLDIRRASHIAADLALAASDITGLAGVIGEVAVVSPVLTAAFVGYGNEIAVLALSGPLPRPTIQILSGGVATFSPTGRIVQPSLSGLTGEAGTFAATLLAHTLAGTGYSPVTGSIGGTLPVLVFDAELWQALTAAFRAWALNTRRAALTEYDNFEFNSFTKFNGKVVAAGPAGIFELSGQATDAGTAIDADVLTGAEDFGTTFNKRVPRVYLGYSAAGPLEFRTVVSKDGTRIYLLPYNGQDLVQRRRVPIGRGPKSPWWQFGVTNRDGADFLISDILVYPEKSSRRVL